MRRGGDIPILRMYCLTRSIPVRFDAPGEPGGYPKIEDASRYLLTSIDLPIVSRVIEAREKAPCLAFVLKLEMPAVRELLSREEIQVAEAPSDSPAIATGETTVEFLSACCRLMDL